MDYQLKLKSYYCFIMKNVFFGILFLFLCASVSFAQPKQLTLNGIISMTTGETFPYKLVFTETEGQIKGYSITYKAPDDTKTLISGIVDRRQHTFTFKETEIIYSHGVQTKAYMCLINAGLQYNASGRGNILTGPINTNETDKTSCTAGTILFTDGDEIQNLFAYHEKFDTVISMRKKSKEAFDAVKPVAKVQEEPLVTERITAGIEKAYDWTTDTVIIDVWDGGNVDGDRVTLSLNGKPYLTNYFLVKEKRQLRLPLLQQGVNTISFQADNEGSDPPNTASVMLTDGTRQYSILAYNPKGQQALIKIRRVRSR
ncbi:MAG: Protein of unknown function precursor [Flavipsychrobacter sp.]|nr:Protein of unknown function precursor [Flavipsychrobacter sp.]